MGASLVTQMVKHLTTMWETWVQSLGREDPLEKEMATHSSILAWKIPWTEDPGRLQSMGSQPCVRKNPWRRAWQPTPVFLPGEFHGNSMEISHHFIGNRRGKVEAVTDFTSLGSKITADSDCSTKLKDASSLEEQL